LPTQGQSWAPGYWRQKGNGWYWAPGHWRKYPPGQWKKRRRH